MLQRVAQVYPYFPVFPWWSYPRAAPECQTSYAKTRSPYVKGRKRKGEERVEGAEVNWGVERVIDLEAEHK